ncbi:MAG TPA: lysophospholipid acyltransferase family protein [Chroococcales cyanobacterium]
MLDFRPPLDSPALIWFVNLMLPLYMKYQLHDTQLKIAPGAMERFQKLKGKRAMICPNHSNRHDPQIMFAFSREMGEPFNFVAAREVFDWEHGLNGWWLQHLGCYSVVRGAPDRESFKTTKRILAEGKKKLVLFPEGEISRQNDTLMSLESGAAQLTFWAVEDLAKSANGDLSKLEPVYIVPMAMKYTFPYDIKPQLRAILSTLEEHMGIRNQQDQSFYTRLRKIAEVLMVVLEKEYQQRPPENSTLNERIALLRQSILDNVARQLNLTVNTSSRQLEQVRVLRNHLDDVVYSDEDHYSEYQRKLHEEHTSMLKGLYADLDRVVNFIAIYDGYLKESVTQERFADTLSRLEREILRTREPSHHGPRVVLVDVGEPINLSQYCGDLKKDKRGTISKVTDELFAQMTEMLKKLDELRKPIYLD